MNFQICFKTVKTTVSESFCHTLRHTSETSGQRAAAPPSVRSTSWKIEIGRDWYRSQSGRDLEAKVRMCTPVHGLSVFFRDRTNRKSVCRSTHYYLCPSISSNSASVPISIDLLKKGVRADCQGLGFRTRGLGLQF